jgi:hypothetical protein
MSAKDCRRSSRRLQSLWYVARYVFFKTVPLFEPPGLELARLADLPTDALTEAKRVAEKLVALQAKDEKESESSQIALRRKALLRVTFRF